MFKRYSRLFLIAIILVTCEILVTVPVVRATNPAIFIEPSTVIGDLTPTPGSVTQWKVNVSDIVSPGLITYEFYMALDLRAFPEYYPIGNSNFTANANGWTTTVSGTGTPTSGWEGADGNPTPGSGPGSYYLRATSTAGAVASLTFYTDYSFTWPGILPLDGAARLSLAFKISGNSVAASGATIHIQVVEPDATSTSVFGPKYYSATRPWSYNYTLANAAAFNPLSGTYKLRLRTVLKTLAAGTGNYVQVNWDDVGLMLAKVQAKEGPFLESDPRNVGRISKTFKYLKFATNSSVYVLESLVGTLYETIWPVQGGGTVAYVNLTSNYGAGPLKLWGTKLLKPGLMGNPEEISPHDAIGAYFDNRIPGDIAGPESPPGSGLFPYDGNVNNYDLTYIRMKFGTNDPQADFTGPENPPDGIVDVRDLRPIGKNYGRHYP